MYAHFLQAGNAILLSMTKAVEFSLHLAPYASDRFSFNITESSCINRLPLGAPELCRYIMEIPPTFATAFH